MKTPEEIKEHLLEYLRFTLRRPGMSFGYGATTVDSMFRHLLDTLCFIEDREEEGGAIWRPFTTGCRWVTGQFEFQHFPFPAYVNEIASVYAEASFRLGYFDPTRLFPPNDLRYSESTKLLTSNEMKRLKATIEGADFQKRDWSEAELHSEFGLPSWEVIGGPTSVACYGCEDQKVKWVFFDLCRKLPLEKEYLEMPILRDFRTGFENDMRLLPMAFHWIRKNAENPTSEKAPNG